MASESGNSGREGEIRGESEELPEETLGRIHRRCRSCFFSGVIAAITSGSVYHGMVEGDGTPPKTQDRQRGVGFPCLCHPDLGGECADAWKGGQGVLAGIGGARTACRIDESPVVGVVDGVSGARGATHSLPEHGIRAEEVVGDLLGGDNQGE